MAEQFYPLEPYLETAVSQSKAFLVRLFTSFQSEQNAQQNQSLPFHQVLSRPLFNGDENIAVSLHVLDTKYSKGHMNPNSKLFMHNHDFYEINYIYRGGVTNYLQDTVFHQVPSQILLMNPYAYHTVETDSPDTLLFNIVIRREFSAEILSNPALNHLSVANLFLDTSLGMSPIQPYLLFDNTLEIQFLLHQMIVEYYQQLPYFQQRLYAKFIDLWSLFARQRDQKMLQPSSQCPKDVIQILNFIREHYADVLLESLSKEFGFSPHSLSQYIQKYTGYKFSEIVSRFKMQNAISYLLYTNLSLSEIVEKIGYNDMNYFIKMFRKNFGVSPIAYRKQQKRN